jgi:ferredoxin
MQCLSFCLFGVFGVDAGKRIAIENSRSCKANCPACSRVCPESAIMFPKHRGGAISGEPVRDAGPEREKMKVDISALLGGDIFSTLRDRSERAKHRFSKDRNPDEAIEERRRCLAAAGLLGDVPPEALASLPSIEEMQRRAGEAKARARAALSNRPSPPQTSP